MTGATITRTDPAFRVATFGDVLRSEWVKLRSVRSAFWALTVTVVLGVGLGAVISAVTARAYATMSASGKLSWDPTGVSQAGVAIASLAIVVLGVLCISSEYSSGMIRTSLIAVPKRGRLLAAKSLVFAGVTLAVGEVTSFTAFFVGQALISGQAPHVALGDKMAFVIGDDARGFLAAMLQRMQPQHHQRAGIGMAENAKHAALLMQRVAIFKR